MREKARSSYNRVKLEEHNFYTGKAPAEVYAEEPFPYKVRRKMRYNGIWKQMRSYLRLI